MEERNKMLTDLRLSSDYHSNDIHHIKPFQTTVHSDSEDDEPTVHDPLLKPTAATPHNILTTRANNSINVEQLPSSPTSQLNM